MERDSLKRAPSIDEEIATLADRLLERSSGDSLLKLHLLEREKLDYSVPSLKAIEKYLVSLGTHKMEDEDEIPYWNTMLITGAYLGEVARRSGSQHHWYSYDAYVNFYPGAKEILSDEAELWNWYILADEDDILLPIHVVQNRMFNDHESSDLFAFVTRAASLRTPQ